MATIIDVIKRLLPDGSNLGAKGSVRSCPIWPPDLFAVAATLVEAHGLYAHPCFVNGWEDGSRAFGPAYVEEVTRLGRLWAESPDNPPRQLKRLWRTLVSCGNRELNSFELLDFQITENILHDPSKMPWPLALLKMMAIADEASAGVGFGPNISNMTPVAYILFSELIEREANPNDPRILKYLPFSLCLMIPPDIACVQPKTNLPEVGCTLRSLSHHLALLPSRGVVETDWYYANPKADSSTKPLNLLLIPFPFVVHGRHFAPVDPPSEEGDGYFRINPGWLPYTAGVVEPEKIAKFVSAVIAAAEKEAAEVHAVVFPESALPDADCKEIAVKVAKAHPHLELFITGTVAANEAHSEEAPTLRNEAFTARFDNGEMLRCWRQGKHHRWRLEKTQIKRYHLGHILHPGDENRGNNWWEQTEIWPRRCRFSVVRRGASLAVLICEDLARFDPVLPVINAIGPNLVIALLMDGPQWERRWPGRYASVLADDPGSSVLTLTCLGMIRRSWMPGVNDRQTVALWKDPGNAAIELDLPSGDHALLLSLTMSMTTQQSLDMRDDGRQTVRFRLNAARGIRANTKDFAAWPELP